MIDNRVPVRRELNWWGVAALHEHGEYLVTRTSNWKTALFETEAEAVEWQDNHYGYLASRGLPMPRVVEVRITRADGGGV